MSQVEFVAVFISIVLGLGVTHILLGFGETILKASAGLRPMPDDYVVYAVVLSGSAVACLLSRSTKVLAAGGLVWLGIDLYYNATALGALGDLFTR